MDMVVQAHIQNTGYERLELGRLCHVDLTLECHWVEAEPGLGHTQVLPLPPHHSSSPSSLASLGYSLDSSHESPVQASFWRS